MPTAEELAATEVRKSTCCVWRSGDRREYSIVNHSQSLDGMVVVLRSMWAGGAVREEVCVVTMPGGDQGPSHPATGTHTLSLAHLDDTDVAVRLAGPTVVTPGVWRSVMVRTWATFHSIETRTGKWITLACKVRVGRNEARTLPHHEPVFRVHTGVTVERVPVGVSQRHAGRWRNGPLRDASGRATPVGLPASEIWARTDPLSALVWTDPSMTLVDYDRAVWPGWAVDGVWGGMEDRALAPGVMSVFDKCACRVFGRVVDPEQASSPDLDEGGRQFRRATFRRDHVKHLLVLDAWLVGQLEARVAAFSACLALGAGHGKGVLGFMRGTPRGVCAQVVDMVARAILPAKGEECPFAQGRVAWDRAVPDNVGAIRFGAERDEALRRALVRPCLHWDEVRPLWGGELVDVGLARDLLWVLAGQHGWPDVVGFGHEGCDWAEDVRFTAYEGGSALQVSWDERGARLCLAFVGTGRVGLMVGEPTNGVELVLPKVKRRRQELPPGQGRAADYAYLPWRCVDRHGSGAGWPDLLYSEGRRVKAAQASSVHHWLGGARVVTECVVLADEEASPPDLPGHEYDEHLADLIQPRSVFEGSLAAVAARLAAVRANLAIN